MKQRTRAQRTATFTVDYTVTDGNGNTSTCTVTFEVNDNDAPVISGCPVGNQQLNTNGNGSCELDIPTAAALGITATDNCVSPLTINQSETTHTGTAHGGTFTVDYTVTDGNGNTSTCTVTFEVNDNDAPVISGCPVGNQQLNTNGNGSCEVSIPTAAALGITAVDNCVSPLTINQSEMMHTGTAHGGTFTVDYTVTDGHGNTSTCTVTFEVNDNDAPAVSCPTNQTVPPTTADPCTATVTGIDAIFSDNCGAPALTYALSGVTTGSGNGQASGLTFNAGVTTVTYTATDGAGLQSSCMFTVTVQACLEISGTILWSTDLSTPVEQATVNLSGSATGSDLTDVNGDFSFILLPQTGNFTLKPVKNINFSNGLFVNDALAIQQHLTGINVITDPYRIIACDVNGSNSVSTFDATLVKQLLLGNPLVFSQFKKSWRFVTQTWTPVLPPWGFPEQIDLTGVSTDQPGQDFYGIKIGDVIANFADPANFGGGSNSPAPLVLRAEDRLLEQGKPVVVTLTADAFDDLAAWQFALKFDPQHLHFDSVEVVQGGVLPLAAADFGLFGLSAGELRAVWSGATAVALPGGTEVFRLHFTALESGMLLSDQLRLDDAILPAAAFNSALEQAAMELNYSPYTSTLNPGGNQYLLLQNQPNPFTAETAIGFVLPGACAAQLRVFDATGRLLWQRDGEYPVGYSVEKLRLDGLTASGVLFYELTTPFGTLTKRMVRVGN
ncbi:MAG: HYR domain-containing protein [Saprospiraceae bacterium]